MYPFTKGKKVSNERFNLADAFLSVVDRTQATIQFKPDGTILTANDNFLKALGFKLEEVVGKHHSMFIKAEYSRTPEYQSFWRDLAGGKSPPTSFHELPKTDRSFGSRRLTHPVLMPREKRSGSSKSRQISPNGRMALRVSLKVSVS